MITIEPIEKLTTQLSRLPGIGRKTAQRLAYHILSVPEAQAKELADAITAARENVCNCPICGTYTDVIPCRICSDDIDLLQDRLGKINKRIEEHL